MKLSEIKGERVFDVIADIIDPVATIAADEEAMLLFSAKDKPEDMTQWEYFVQRARKAVPVLMRRYKTELCTILATTQGVTTEEYVEGLNVPKLFADVLDLITDSEFVTFFS